MDAALAFIRNLSGQVPVYAANGTMSIACVFIRRRTAICMIRTAGD